MQSVLQRWDAGAQTPKRKKKRRPLTAPRRFTCRVASCRLPSVRVFVPRLFAFLYTPWKGVPPEDYCEACRARFSTGYDGLRKQGEARKNWSAIWKKDADDRRAAKEGSLDGMAEALRGDPAPGRGAAAEAGENRARDMVGAGKEEFEEAL